MISLSEVQNAVIGGSVDVCAFLLQLGVDSNRTNIGG